MTNEELVKRLRCQLFGNCPACVNWYTEEVEPGLLRERCAAVDAADAIEELSEERDMFRKAMTDEHNRAAKLVWEKEHQWISVTERLPEKDGKYLCTVKSFSHYNSKQYRYVDVLVFQDYCFFEFGLGTERVTHWMPLPEPPKEES